MGIKWNSKLLLTLIACTLVVLCGSFVLRGVNAIDYKNSITNDTRSWYSVSLSQGQSINLLLTVPSGCDFDLYITTSTMVMTNMAHRHPPSSSVQEASSINPGSTPESISWMAPRAGIYYVCVHSHEGSGEFTLSSDVALQSFNPFLELFNYAGIISGGITGVILILALAFYYGNRIDKRHEQENDVVTLLVGPLTAVGMGLAIATLFPLLIPGMFNGYEPFSGVTLPLMIFFTFGPLILCAIGTVMGFLKNGGCAALGIIGLIFGIINWILFFLISAGLYFVLDIFTAIMQML